MLLRIILGILLSPIIVVGLIFILLLYIIALIVFSIGTIIEYIFTGEWNWSIVIGIAELDF
jgi:hypothetical protein